MPAPDPRPSDHLRTSQHRFAPAQRTRRWLGKRVRNRTIAGTAKSTSPRPPGWIITIVLLTVGITVVLREVPEPAETAPPQDPPVYSRFEKNARRDRW